MLSENIDKNKSKPQLNKLKKGLAGLVAGSVLSMGAQAQQQWFNVNADVNITPRYVEARVSNNSHYMWECQGVAYGRTQHNQWVRNDFYFNVPPGQYRGAYVNNWGNIFFVDGQANVECRTVSRW